MKRIIAVITYEAYVPDDLMVSEFMLETNMNLMKTMNHCLISKT